MEQQQAEFNVSVNNTIYDISEMNVSRQLTALLLY